MSSTGTRDRIFVVGVPRSGTTLVQSLLAAHSEVTSFTESHFFSRHFRALEPSALAVMTKSPWPRVLEFLAENGFDESALRDSEGARSVLRPGPTLALRSDAATRTFLALLDELAAIRGASRWIEKTPRHLRYVPHLARVGASHGGVRFVHVVRQGVDCVASLARASASWERPYDLATCVRRWNEDLRRSLRRTGEARDVFVCYEDLARRPDATLRALCERLELPFEADLVERYAEASDALVTPAETWKQGVGGGVRAPRSSPELSAEDRAEVERALDHELYARVREHAVGAGAGA